MIKADASTGPSHFDGRLGKRRLLEVVKAQTLVAQDEELARAVMKIAHTEKHPVGAEIMTQGAADNDLFLIVSGSVSIRINGREVATRQAGTHVGEMALVDALAKRSATVVTVEPTIALRITEPSFTKLADQRPDLWRRLAVEVAKRLRERSQALRPPNNEPVVFFGSSSEGVKVTEELSRIYRKRRVVVRPWTVGVFQVSSTPIESLVTLAGNADFAVLVLTADDITLSRQLRHQSPRDNVVFEVGLFIGAIGRERVVILKPKGCDIKVPTDLVGVIWLDYARGGNTSLRARLKHADNELWKLIKKHGSR